MPVKPRSGDASDRPPSRWLRRRRPLLLVSGMLTVLTFLQQPGRIVADTKSDLVVDPGRFLARTLDLWDPSASFGRIQNQAVGYWFPMGPFFWVGERLGVPGWVIQRLWWSVILVAALWGLVKLAEALDIGTPGARLAGGVAFAIGPAILVELGSRSLNVLPLAVLPFVLLPLVHGSRAGSVRRAACASALVVLAMGGVNATVVASALFVPLLYLVTRRRGHRRRGLTLWWIGAVAAVTFWWWGPLLLQQRYTFDILEYTEDAAATTNGMSVTEVLRGTGFWLSRLRDAGIPWLPAGLRLGSNVAVLGTTTVVAAGLAGLAHRRLPERSFLALSLAAGVGLMAAGYAGELAGPLSGPARDLLDGPLAAFRNVHKLAPLVALPLALGAVHALGLLADAIGGRRGETASRAVSGRVLAAVVGAVLVAAALPIVTADVAQTGSFERIPPYWEEAVSWLEENSGAERAVLVPANPFAHYRWGAPTDEPLQALQDGPWAVRDIIPFGGVRSTRLLDGYEELFDDRRDPSGLTPSLARSGVGWVVVRNDLDPVRATASPSPFVVDALDRAPGLERVAGFGPTVETEPSRERLTPTVGAGRPRQALEIYRVGRPVARVAAYDLDTSLSVLGNTETVQTLAQEGLLDDRGVLLAGDDPELARRTGRWVITDDFRRRDVEFGRVHGAASYTLQPDELAPGDSASLRGPREPVDRQLPADEVSVGHVELDGVRDVTASSYYTGFAREPGYQPYAAVDGDLSTAWHLAGFRGAVDEWWRIRFDGPRELSTVEIRLPEVGSGEGHITDLRVTTDAGSVEGSFASADDVLRLELPPGPTEEVELTILGAEQIGSELLTLGIAEVTFDDRPPVDRVVVTPEADVTGPVAVVLTRATSDPFDAVAQPEDRVLDRRITLPERASYSLGGTAVAVPGAALDALVDAEATGADRVMAEATSTRGGLPAFGPAKALDGDPATAWVADVDDPEPRLTLRFDESRPVEGLRLTFPPEPALVPERITVTSSAGSRTVPVGPDGSIGFAPVVTDHLELAPGVDEPASGIIGLAEVEPLPERDDPPVAPGSGERSIDLPCGAGPDVVVDGEVVPTRVSGTLADLERLQPLAMTGCERVDLAAGSHRVTAPPSGGFQAESVVLDPPPPLGPGQSRTADVVDWGTEDREVRIGAGRVTALLALDENRNDGWVARLDGQDLRPTTVDGWRQAWVVPPGDGGSVEITFRPGTWYDRVLVTGLLLVLLVVAAAVVPARRAPTAEPAPPRRIPDVVVVGVATVALALAAGALALVVPVLWLGVRRPSARVAIAAGAFAAVGVAMVLDPRPPGAEYAALGQTLAAVAVAAALVGPATGPRRADGDETTAT